MDLPREVVENEVFAPTEVDKEVNKQNITKSVVLKSIEAQNNFQNQNLQTSTTSMDERSGSILYMKTVKAEQRAKFLRRLSTRGWELTGWKRINSSRGLNC